MKHAIDAEETAKLKLHKELIVSFKDMEVEVPEKYSVHALPNEIFMGDCYESAIAFLTKVMLRENLESDEIIGEICDAYIVHGTMNSHETRFRHAWVELPNGIIFEPVYQRFYDAKAYLIRRNGVAETKYTHAEIVPIVLRLGYTMYHKDCRIKDCLGNHATPREVGRAVVKCVKDLQDVPPDPTG